MMSPRQEQVLARIPRVKGATRSDFEEIEHKLLWYKFSDHDLDLIEKGIIEFEKLQQEKQIAKQRKRDAIKAAKRKRADENLKRFGPGGTASGSA